jgi:hypothetical protein
MACEDCERRKIEENVDGLYEDVDWLRRVARNHALVLIFTACAVVAIAARLNAKGLLPYRELLGTSDG